jgi:hypothetical protein
VCSMFAREHVHSPRSSGQTETATHEFERDVDVAGVVLYPDHRC